MCNKDHQVSLFDKVLQQEALLELPDLQKKNIRKHKVEQGERYKSMSILHLDYVDHEGWMDSPQQTQPGNISKPIQ